jgi:hypothetical protein
MVAIHQYRRSGNFGGGHHSDFPTSVFVLSDTRKPFACEMMRLPWRPPIAGQPRDHDSGPAAATIRQPRMKPRRSNNLARPAPAASPSPAAPFWSLLHVQLVRKLVHPYPETHPLPPPRGFMRFIWFCTKGVRPYIAAMTLMTAIIGVFEALLFAALGRIVDWLAKIEPAQLWAQEGTRCCGWC